jgi:hypothetical protein
VEFYHSISSASFYFIQDRRSVADPDHFNTDLHFIFHFDATSDPTIGVGAGVLFSYRLRYLEEVPKSKFEKSKISTLKSWIWVRIHDGVSYPAK